jgi:hypothetical protein
MQTKLIAICLVSSCMIASCGGGADASSSSTGGAEAAAARSNNVTAVGINQTLKTEYFDVTVNSVRTAKTVKIDEFEELKQEEGNKYLILDITLKNTDKESRMMFDGVVKINANGQEYKYEQAEPVMAEGWGMIMDNINPLVTKRTRLVYKIPAALTGTGVYNPGRSDEDEVINLGNIQ